MSDAAGAWGETNPFPVRAAVMPHLIQRGTGEHSAYCSAAGLGDQTDNQPDERREYRGTGVSRSTSSGRCRSGPATAPAGRRETSRTGCRRPTTAPTASATSTAATASATTSCGASIRRRKGGDHTLAALKSIRAARPDGAPIYVIMDNLSANKTPADPGLGGAQQGRAVLHPDQRVLGQPDRGPVRAAAHLHDGRLGPPQPHRRWPAGCRTTCAGATPTPATPTSWPPNAANAPASAANANNAGADPTAAA